MELKRYWEIIWRRKELFIVIVALVIGIPLITAYILTPIYSASARVAITVKDFQTDYLSELPPTLGTFRFVEARNVVDTYTILIKNPGSVSALIKQLNLRNADGELLKPESFLVNFLNYPFFLFKQKRAFEVNQIASSEIFEIVGYSSDPQEAVDIANSAVEIFLDLFSDLYHQKTIKALSVMEKLLPQVKHDLHAAEERQTNLMVQEEIVNLSEQSRIFLGQLSSLEAVYHQTKRARLESLSEIEGIKKALTKIPEIYESSIVLEANPVIDSYKIQLLEFETSLARLLAELTQEHPEVKAVQEQINKVKNSLREEVLSAKKDTRNPYYAELLQRYGDAEIEFLNLKARETVLAEQINAMKTELQEIPSKAIAIKEVTRETTLLEGYYNSLKKGMNLAELALKMDINNASVVDYAHIIQVDPYKPYFPKKKKIAIIAMFLGISLALFAVFFLTYMDNTLTTGDEAEKTLGVTLLAEVPTLPQAMKQIREGKSVIGNHQGDRFMDAFWNLKSEMRLTISETVSKIMAVTSVDRGEGKSLVSLFTAKVLAESGMRVLLIDSNFRRPSLNTLFKLPDLKGLTHLLLQDQIHSADIHNAIAPSEFKNLSLMPTSQYSHPLQLIDSPRMEEFIALLTNSEDFDRIIFDTSSLADGKAALLLSHLVDKVIVVVQESSTEIKSAIKAVKKLDTPQKKVLGIVFNRGKRKFI